MACPASGRKSLSQIPKARARGWRGDFQRRVPARGVAESSWPCAHSASSEETRPHCGCGRVMIQRPAGFQLRTHLHTHKQMPERLLEHPWGTSLQRPRERPRKPTGSARSGAAAARRVLPGHSPCFFCCLKQDLLGAVRDTGQSRDWRHPPAPSHPPKAQAVR